MMIIITITIINLTSLVFKRFVINLLSNSTQTNINQPNL